MFREHVGAAAIVPPFFEARFCFVECHDRGFIARHGRPLRRKSGGRTTLTVIQG